MLLSTISKAGLWNTYERSVEAVDTSLAKSEAGWQQSNASALSYLGDAASNLWNGTGSVTEPLGNAVNSAYTSAKTFAASGFDAGSSMFEAIEHPELSPSDAVNKYWEEVGASREISEATHPSIKNEFASTPTNSSTTPAQNTANSLSGESTTQSSGASRPSDAFGPNADYNSEVTSSSNPSNSVSNQSPQNSTHAATSNPNTSMNAEGNSIADSSMPTGSQEISAASNNTSEKAPNPEALPTSTPSACITGVCQEFIQILGNSTHQIKNNPSAMVPGTLTSVSSMESQSVNAAQLQDGSQQMAVGNQATNDANMIVIKKVDKYEEAALGQLYNMQLQSGGNQLAISQARNDMEYIKTKTTEFYKWSANEVHASNATRASISSLSGYSFGIGPNLDK